jgi:hypothetical protein
MFTIVPRFNKVALERTAAGDLWKHTLSQIPTLYGRLSYLASLRDPNSGIYRHHGLAAMFGREESNRALRESHEQAFVEWIRLAMREKKVDLTQHFSSLVDPPKVVVDHLWTSRAYEAQVPASARRAERRLFCADLEALLETIRNAMRGDAPTQGSSRPA